MGDGIFDHVIMRKVKYAITVKDALSHVKKQANYVTHSSGSNRAVAEACIYILKKFYNKSLSKLKNFNSLI